MRIPFKRLHPYAMIPHLATPGSSAVDLFALEGVKLRHGDTEIVHTGLCVAVPVGMTLLLYSRSGLARRGLCLANGVGVIDSDYRGEILVALLYRGPSDSIIIKAGERVAQAMLAPCYSQEWSEVAALPETIRGAGGFGSTGQ